MNFLSVYKYYMDDLADPRVKNWPLMKGVHTPLFIIILYLFIVKIAAPCFMENRKPYNITNFIRGYNIFQVICCISILYGILTNGWTTHYSLGCEPVDYSDNPMAIRLAGWVWWTCMLKLVELFETVFFILRKKYNQVSGLHLYHHVSTFLIGWIATKYIPGGMTTFPILINSVIHIIMYLYYFLSTFKQWQKVLSKWKNKLTIMQMIQFCIILCHAIQGFAEDCTMPSIAGYIFVPNVLLIFYMFFNFYRASYTKQSKQV